MATKNTSKCEKMNVFMISVSIFAGVDIKYTLLVSSISSNFKSSVINMFISMDTKVESNNVCFARIY